ncbi:hypothetical protein [Chitinophaga qingshengii]|uniref:Uncharacterized protein n=1 Tax=Chitinophaga qingshengii TaxID=1569794 RepID=A0ABR7TGM3_9BACT|nr:hypothetical protein [Chitinophaga qingshengii]MBC9929100.1 hypothetical protein [Chitinophaga qingshengii]
MKKLRIAWTAVSALLGIGGAYATVYQGAATVIHIPYNWYLTNGQYAFNATINVAKAICPAENGVTCLIGTASKYSLATTFVFKP